MVTDQVLFSMSQRIFLIAIRSNVTLFERQNDSNALYLSQGRFINSPDSVVTHHFFFLMLRDSFDRPLSCRLESYRQQRNTTLFL